VHKTLISNVDNILYKCPLSNFSFSLGNNYGQFSFENRKRQEVCYFHLLHCTEGIKCCFEVLPDQDTTYLYKVLIDLLQLCLDDVCSICLPSARKPICHLNCPLEHPAGSGNSPHLPLNEIREENDLVCSITEQPIPYSFLFGFQGKWFCGCMCIFTNKNSAYSCIHWSLMTLAKISAAAIVSRQLIDSHHSFEINSLQ